MDVEEKNIGARLAPALYPFADEIMAEMERRKMTLEEAETLPEVLAQRIRKNNERFEKSRPFIVCKN